MSETQPQLRRPVLRYFEGPNRGWAVAALRTYCEGRSDSGGWRYSGAWFDRLADRSDPYTFTTSDLVAVTMLSVTVPAHAAIRILEPERDDWSHLLRSIGGDHPIWEADEAELATDSPANELWHRLQGLGGIGPVIAGKLLAAKRPNLLPVYDRHVQAALGWPRGQFWLAMQASMAQAHQAVAEAISEAEVVVAPLRAVDIVVWMHQHGWVWADGELDAPPTLD